jgi:hypothetical protein
MPMIRRLCWMLALAVSACSDPEGGGTTSDSRSCPIFPTATYSCGERLAGDGVSVEVVKAVSCPLCTVENPELAIDDDPATYATVTVPLEADQSLIEGGITLIAHASPGASYGGFPGASFGFDSISIGGWVFVHTLLGGQVSPDRHTAYMADTIQQPTPTDEPIYWTAAGTPFDAISVTIGPSRDSSSIPPVIANLVVRVHEFCTDTRISDICIPDYLGD